MSAPSSSSKTSFSSQKTLNAPSSSSNAQSTSSHVNGSSRGNGNGASQPATLDPSPSPSSSSSRRGGGRGRGRGKSRGRGGGHQTPIVDGGDSPPKDGNDSNQILNAGAAPFEPGVAPAVADTNSSAGPSVPAVAGWGHQIKGRSIGISEATSSHHHNHNHGNSNGHSSHDQDASRGRAQNKRGRGRGRGGRGTNDKDGANSQAGSEDGEPVDRHRNGNRRRQAFGGKLTSGPNVEDADEGAQKKTTVIIPPVADYADLRSRLVAELNAGTYDCSICYSTVGRSAAVWACSQCHNILHLTCIKQWASSSVQAAEEQNALQEDPAIRARKGTWRCPGCQLARAEVPTLYYCWDGQVQDPKPTKRGVPPHSCGKSCQKANQCPHGCSAGICHPGPCPPCPVTIHHRCFCGKQEVAVRCSQLAKSQTASSKHEAGISCGELCHQWLSCGKHRCQRKCHAGPCGHCEEQVEEKCYCGKNVKRMNCGTGSRKLCQYENEVWEGTWECEDSCDRKFNCGYHSCTKFCHPPSIIAPMCPLSPEVCKTCPCGAESRTDRKSCQDPIKTCGSVCGKAFPCGHSCSIKCHLGECPPCRVPVSAPCRCGESRPTLPCCERTSTDGSESPADAVLCDVVCRSLRHCGKHECKRRCCPLAFQAKMTRRQQSTRNRPLTQAQLEEQDPAMLHACPVPCNKQLTCGQEGHTCPQNCHRGPCQPCLQACFTEVVCHCGRTVLEPPVPCGQRPVCRFPCSRPQQACGHPRVPHDCHEDGPCPPCIYLTTKTCECGKNMVPNVPCHRQRVSCGAICGALKPCGFHRCMLTCHPGAPGSCGECTAICNKPRSKCGHPCKDKCHAPARCDETQPCEEVVIVSCPCGHLKQKTRCGAGVITGDISERQLKCNEACSVAQRNVKLAEALGLDVAEKTADPTYDAELLAFYGSDNRFALDLETILTDFVRSPRHSMILPSASKSQRKFTHELAAVFGLQTESLDLEPKRSVQVRRTGEARVPRLLPGEVWAKAKREHEAGLASSSSSSSRLISMKQGNAAGGANTFNALLLDGVFGIDEDFLRAILTTTSANAPSGSAPLRLIPFSTRWMSDETVVLTTADANTPASRLLSAKANVLRMLKLNQAAKNVIACYYDGRTNKVTKREDKPGGSLVLASAGYSPASSGRTSPMVHLNGLMNPGPPPEAKLSGWAAVAGSAPTASSSSSSSKGSTHIPAPANAWGGASATSNHRVGSSSSTTTTPRIAAPPPPSSSSSSSATAISVGHGGVTPLSFNSFRRAETSPSRGWRALPGSAAAAAAAAAGAMDGREATPEAWDD